MSKILDPQIEVEDIHLLADKQAKDFVDQKINEWGYAMPVVKINELPLNMGDIDSLNVYINMFDVPSFNMSIKDYNSKIQASLKNKQDSCIIFIGTKDFYIKFNCLITNVSTSFSKTINVSGVWYQKELFDYKQESFVDTTVVDILTKLCEDTKLGLFTYDNSGLQVKPEYHINPNIQRLPFIADVISTYTDNLWCVDTFGFLHIGSLQSILSKPIDKYSINPEKNEPLEDGPQDILLTFNRSQMKDQKEKDEKYKYEIAVENLSIDTNFSMTKLAAAATAVVYSGTGSGRYLDMNATVGIEESSDNENTFSGFLKSKYPLRDERINKILYGNTINLELKNYMIEIVPFTLVNLEIYYNRSANINTKPIKETDTLTGGEPDFEAEDDQEKAGYRLDEVHSGKHFVVGYSYHYRKNRQGSPNAITQKLTLI